MKLTLKSKLSSLLILPLVFISAANGVLLTLAGQPKLVLANILILLGFLIAGKIFIQGSFDRTFRRLNELGKKVETIEYSSSLLVKELNRSALERKDVESWKRDMMELKEKIPDLSSLSVSQELKSLLILTLQEAERAGANGKGYVLIAKEIARLCSEFATSLKEAKDRIEEASKLTASLDEKLEQKTALTDIEQSSFIAEGIEAQVKRLYKSLPEMETNEAKKDLEDRAPFETAVLRKAIRKRAA